MRGNESISRIRSGYSHFLATDNRRLRRIFGENHGFVRTGALHLSSGAGAPLEGGLLALGFGLASATDKNAEHDEGNGQMSATCLTCFDVASGS